LTHSHSMNAPTTSEMQVALHDKWAMLSWRQTAARTIQIAVVSKCSGFFPLSDV
jgi:hypothetical protein